MQNRWRIVVPVVLIGLGLLILIQNLGLFGFDWSIWEMAWRLWPILLIGLGLEVILGRRTPWGSVAVAAIMLVLLGGSVAFYRYWGPTQDLGPLGETINEPLHEATSARVEIRPSVAQLRLHEGADSGSLISGTVHRLNGERLSKSASGSGGNVSFLLASDGVHLYPSVNTRGGTWDLGLTSSIPIDLTVRTGVGESTLDLSHLNLTQVDLKMGVGATMVALPQQGQLRVTVEGGVGQVTVNVPDTMAVRLQVQTGLGSVSVNGWPDMHNHASYTSPGYDSAANRVDLSVKGGVGEVIVRQVH